jgi:hypothetical protein
MKGTCEQDEVNWAWMIDTWMKIKDFQAAKIPKRKRALGKGLRPRKNDKYTCVMRQDVA